MNLSLVSIIIPVFNRAKLISETLDSVLKQTYKNWECILIDDGSNDNTIEIIDQYVTKDKRFKKYIRPDNYLPGGNGARNYGLDISNGEFIQWFDSDDIMKENFLSAKIEVLRNNTENQSVISRNTFFQGDKILGEKFNFERKYPKFYENTITVKIPVWTPSIMFRKSFLLQTGERLDESLKRLQEYEFFTRIFVLHNHPTKLLNKSLCLVRIHEGSKTSAFDNEKTKEMYNSYYEANLKIISLLIHENKFTKNLENFFYNNHKRDITNSFQMDYNGVVEKVKLLIIKYLKHNKSKIRIFRFRIGFFLYRVLPVPNFFLIYEIKNPFLKLIMRSLKRAYKILFKRGYLKEKLLESGIKVKLIQK